MSFIRNKNNFTGMKKTMRAAAVNLLGFVLSNDRIDRLASEALAKTKDALTERIVYIDTSRGKIGFYCIGDMTLWRAQTLLTKEPETIEWIDSFASEDIFWDIGANIGMYSLYAASRLRKTIAFEPGPANYCLLCQNIELNRFQYLLSAYAIAMADRTEIDWMKMPTTSFGSSLASLDNKDGFPQSVLTYSVDDFIDKFRLPFPNHIKIDVDGIEPAIIRGADKTIRDRRLKSVMVEMERGSDDSKKITCELEGAGFKLISARHSAMFDNGPYANIFNCRFERDVG